MLNQRLQQQLEPPRDLRALAARPDGVRVGIVGGSMEPTLSAGEVVRVHRCGYLRPGDAFLFETKSGPCMLHRAILEVPFFGWVFEIGDAGLEVGVVARSRVIGRAALRRRLPPPRHYASAARLAVRWSLRALARGDLIGRIRQHR